MRLHVLDAVRGLAALSVVFYHCLLVYPALYEVLGGRGVTVYERQEAWVAWLTLVPWRFLWAGREAVLLFFVLSGFVLTLPFLRPNGPGYRAFIAKRFCRLYLPFAASVALSGGLMLALGIEEFPGPESTSWLALSWTEIPTSEVVLRQLMFSGEMTLNNVAWSLAVEWYIGLAFPLIVALVRWSWAAGLVAGFGAVALNLISLKVLDNGEAQVGWYLLYFVLGTTLAVHRERVCAAVAGTGDLGRALLWVLAYLLFKSRWLLPLGATASDMANGLGATLLISLVLTSSLAHRVLNFRIFRWLGQISYSLYLVHVPLLVGTVYTTGQYLPEWGTLIVAVGVSLAAAHGFHLAVEAPAARLGRLVAVFSGIARTAAPGR